VQAPFKDTGGWDTGDIHADDLGADFGFNAYKSPTTSFRFFVRHRPETLGGAIARLSQSGTSLATGPTFTAGTGTGSPGDGASVTRQPASTGWPLPSNYFNEDTGSHRSRSCC